MTENTAVIAPRFHHVNLKTTRLDELIRFYRTLVAAEVIFRDETGAWLSNDDANHRIALLAFPNFADDPEKDTRTGMHHSAFEYASFDDLNASYERLKEAGITPAPVPGPRDDALLLLRRPGRQPRRVLQVDCFGDWRRSKEWMRSSAEFKANPIGVFVDPDRIAADRAGGLQLLDDPCQGHGRRLLPRSRPRWRSRHEALSLRRGRRAVPRHRRGRQRGRPGRPFRSARPRRGASARARPAAEVPGDRAQLRRPHRRERHGGTAVSGVLQQADHLRRRSRTPTCTCRVSRICSTTRASSRSSSVSAAVTCRSSAPTR